MKSKKIQAIFVKEVRISIYLEQECILIGCVPYAGGCLPLVRGVCLQTPPWADPSVQPLPLDRHPPCPVHAGVTAPPPPVNRIPDRRKNITFPQLLLRTIIKCLSDKSSVYGRMNDPRLSRFMCWYSRECGTFLKLIY